MDLPFAHSRFFLQARSTVAICNQVADDAVSSGVPLRFLDQTGRRKGSTMTKNSENVPALSKASRLDVPVQESVLATLQYVGEPALLAHESRDEYLALRHEYFTELGPQGALESQFIEDVL